MVDQLNHKFILDKDNEILIHLPRGVFAPTETTGFLLRSVRKFISKPGKVLDLGAGSGIVGVFLNKEGLVKEPLYASDLSLKALDCMKINAELHHFPIVARQGSSFDPWKDEKFDYIVNDVSGIAEGVAQLSPWFEEVPCQTGIDGSSLVVEILQNAPKHLNPGGLFFFPIISLSNVNTILTEAKKAFSHIQQLSHAEWPLPINMYKHTKVLDKLCSEDHIQITKKSGVRYCFTDIYVAHNN